MSVGIESKGKCRRPDLTGSPDRPSIDCFPRFAALRPLWEACGHTAEGRGRNKTATRPDAESKWNLESKGTKKMQGRSDNGEIYRKENR